LQAKSAKEEDKKERRPDKSGKESFIKEYNFCKEEAL